MFFSYRYNHKRPITGDHITLASWSEGSSHRGKARDVTRQLVEAGKTVHAHNILDKRCKPRVSTKQALVDWVGAKIDGVYGVAAWDVLNEVMGSYPVDWLLAVLSEIRNKQPDSLLFWNEYALKDRRYWDNLMSVVAIAAADGLLDGVGIQRHIDLRGKLPYTRVTKPAYAMECYLRSWVRGKRLTDEIQRVHSLGLRCHISEVSIKCYDWQVDGAQQFLARLAQISEDNKAWKLTYWDEPAITTMEAN